MRFRSDVETHEYLMAGNVLPNFTGDLPRGFRHKTDPN